MSRKLGNGIQRFLEVFNFRRSFGVKNDIGEPSRASLHLGKTQGWDLGRGDAFRDGYR